MDSTTAYNAAITSYQSAITSLQSNTNTLICFFGALLAFVGIVTAGFLWIIGVQSSKANDKMGKAESLMKEATNLISKAEDKQKQLSIIQEKVSENVTTLTNLLDSQEVKDKLKEIDDIKHFVTQTKNRIDCEQDLEIARRRLTILESSPQWSNFIHSKTEQYKEYFELKSRIDSCSTSLNNWNVLDGEKFAVLKSRCKEIMVETMAFSDDISKKYVNFLSDPLRI